MRETVGELGVALLSQPEAAIGDVAGDDLDPSVRLQPAGGAPGGLEHPALDERDELEVVVTPEQLGREPGADEAGEAGQEEPHRGAALYPSAAGRRSRGRVPRRDRLSGVMSPQPLPARLARLPRVHLDGPLRPLDVRRAGRPCARLLGLAGLPALPAGCGLLLPRTRSVHTVGMRFALDLVWLDTAGRVVRVDARVPPMRLAACRAARSVVELPGGAAACSGLGVRRAG